MAWENYKILALQFLVLLTACDRPSNTPTFQSYTLEIDHAVSKRLDEILPEVRSAGIPLNVGWKVNMEDERAGLDISVPIFGNQTVVLPHRIQLPDHSIWYRAIVSLEKGVLHINADDGAQLWIDGDRTKPVRGNYYPVLKSGEHELTIRVINNAMAGGLRAVQFLNEEQWGIKLDVIQRREILREVLVKQMLLMNTEKLGQRLIQNALEEPNLENLLEAKESLGEKPVLLAEPILQRDASGQTFLRWVSSEAGNSELIYGSDSVKLNMRKSISSEDGVFLTPVDESVKFYQIRQMESVSPVYRFGSKTKIGNNRFMVWADSQSGWPVFDSIMSMANDYQPEFSVGAGDLVNQGDDEQEYLRFMRYLHRGRFVHYPVLGNHDYDGHYENLKAESYKKFLGLPKQKNYFSWGEDEMAFVALDLNESFPVGLPESSEQYQWFLNQLKSEEWTSAEWRFLVLHHPPYSQGWPGYEGELSIRELLEPLYESAKIDMVIAGHTHDYERLIKKFGKQQTAFVVVGGAGGGLEPIENSPQPKMDTVMSVHHFGLIDIRGGYLTFKAIDLKGNVIDTFKLPHDD